jgi:hypothetical protein
VDFRQLFNQPLKSRADTTRDHVSRVQSEAAQHSDSFQSKDGLLESGEQRASSSNKMIPPMSVTLPDL